MPISCSTLKCTEVPRQDLLCVVNTLVIRYVEFCQRQEVKTSAEMSRKFIKDQLEILQKIKNNNDSDNDSDLVSLYGIIMYWIMYYIFLYALSCIIMYYSVISTWVFSLPTPIINGLQAESCSQKTCKSNEIPACLSVVFSVATVQNHWALNWIG